MALTWSCYTLSTKERLYIISANAFFFLFYTLYIYSVHPNFFWWYIYTQCFLYVFYWSKFLRWNNRRAGTFLESLVVFLLGKFWVWFLVRDSFFIFWFISDFTKVRVYFFFHIFRISLLLIHFCCFIFIQKKFWVKNSSQHYWASILRYCLMIKNTKTNPI